MTKIKCDNRKLSRKEMDRLAWSQTIKDIWAFIGGAFAILVLGYMVYELFIALNIRSIFEAHKDVIFTVGCAILALSFVSWWIGSIIIERKKDNMEKMFGLRD